MKLESSVEEAIVEVVTSCGFDCYEVKYFNAGGKTILRVFADGEKGITMDECAEISHGLSEKLDELNFCKTEYTLEVSSPGLDRLLTNQRDFKRFTGKEVQIRFRNDKGKQRKHSGTVTDTSPESVTLKNDEEELAFKFDQILNGKVLI